MLVSAEFPAQMSATQLQKECETICHNDVLSCYSTEDRESLPTILDTVKMSVPSYPSVANSLRHLSAQNVFIMPVSPAVQPRFQSTKTHISADAALSSTSVTMLKEALGNVPDSFVVTGGTHGVSCVSNTTYSRV